MARLSEVSFLGGKVAGVHQTGSRGPIMMLHGNSSCKEVFQPLLDLLSGLEFEAVAIDLPGHGASLDAEQPENTYTLPGYADTTCSIIKELGWSKAGLIGWSLGGHVALECLARDATTSGWTTAFIIGSPPGRPSVEAFEAAFTNEPNTQLAGKPDFTKKDAVDYTTSMIGTAEFVTPGLLDAAIRTDGRARSTLIESVLSGVGADQLRVIETSDARIALVIGKLDPFVRQDYVASIPTKNLWGHKVFQGENWGHAPHWQLDPEFERFALRFFSED